VRNRTGISLLSQRCKREAESLGTRAIEVNRPYLKSDFKRTINYQIHYQLIR
jgi:hypothetical protein